MAFYSEKELAALDESMASAARQYSKNPALGCGIEPNDALLVAYLPKLDAVLQETSVPEGVLMSLDGVALDILGPKRVRWWQVRRAAGDEGLTLPELVWQGRAVDFDISYTHKMSVEKPEGAKLYMRAYSHGPWIRLEEAEGMY